MEKKSQTFSSELAMQKYWNSMDVSERFYTEDNIPLIIRSAGFWNHESGPDFKNAAIKLGDIKQGNVLEPTNIIIQVPLNERSQLSRLYDLPIPTHGSPGFEKPVTTASPLRVDDVGDRLWCVFSHRDAGHWRRGQL